ncbi:hypothetical protein L083_2587 [Actinoplanes sp. N902-109]|nr:hypothetical protein L083_2587 [Actinoplanes sp. N902-109]
MPGAPGLAGPRPKWLVVDPAEASLRLQLLEDGLTRPWPTTPYQTVSG